MVATYTPSKLNYLKVVRTYEDKRKKNTCFLEEGNETISPCLDYNGLNNFLLGYLRCSKQLVDNLSQLTNHQKRTL